MASPFRIFRKHQKVLIATLGVMAMIAFVFLSGPFFNSLTSRGSTNPVVVTTDSFGDIKERQLAVMRETTQAILNFLQYTANDVHMEANDGLDIRLRAANTQRASIGEATEENVVNTWLLAREAEQLGIAISDDAIRRFIESVTEDQLSQEQIEQNIKRAGFSQAALFNALREVLLARQLQMLFLPSFDYENTTPAQRFEYLNRVEQKKAAEVAGIPVERFVDKIEKPSDEVLKEYFEQYKKRFPSPASPEPGFRIPPKVDVQYFVASVDQEASADNITEEEVMAEYNANKDMWDVRESLLSPSWGEEPSEGGDEEPAAGADEEPAADTAKPPADDVDEKPAGDTEEKPAPSADDEPAKGGDESAKKGGEEEMPAADDASSNRSDSPFRLASYFQEDAADGDEEEKPADDATGTETKEETIGLTPIERPEDTAIEPVAEPPKPRKTGPSDKLKDQIRRYLALGKIDTKLTYLSDMMRKYRRKKKRYDADSITNPNLTPPAEFDFAGLAKERGLGHGRTGLSTALQLSESALGRSWVNQQQRFLGLVFGSSLDTYIPKRSFSEEGDIYLFWKTKETEERIPKFEDEGVRERVLLAWKMEQARKLALAEAEKLAEKAKSEGKSLREIFATDTDVTVTQTDPFSWLTLSSVPASLSRANRTAEISQVKGVHIPGEEFMEEVSKLGVDQVGVAMNQPKDNVYLIRVTEIEKSDEVIWTTFESVNFAEYSPAVLRDFWKMRWNWLQQMQDNAGLEWQRDPFVPLGR